MGIMDRIKGMVTKSTVNAPVSAERVNTVFLRALFSGATLSANDCWNLYKSVSTFASVVDMIASEVGKIKPIIKVNDTILEGDKLNYLIDNPGYNRTRNQLIKELTIQYLVTGTAYLHSIGNVRNRPLIFDTFRSIDVSDHEDFDSWPRQFDIFESRRSFKFQRYEELPSSLRYIDGELNELTPIYDVSGDKKGIGQPMLEAVRAEMEMKYSGVLHNLGLLRNGARNSGFLVFKEDLPPEAQKQIMQDFKAQATGPDNAGKVQVMSGGSANFIPSQSTAKDMDWATMQKVAEQSIEKRYRIPAAMSTTDAQTHNNYDTANRVFYEQAVIPNFNVVWGRIARHLSEREGEMITINHDPLSIPVLAEQNRNTAKDLFEKKIISTNEARDMIGLDEVPGGEEIRVTMGETPLSEADSYEYEDIIDLPEEVENQDGPTDRQKNLFRAELDQVSYTILQ